MDKVRVATLQYLIRPITTEDEFRNQVRGLVHTAAEYDCNLVVFPEYFVIQLLSLGQVAGSMYQQIRDLADRSPAILAEFVSLAREFGIHIVAGSMPVRDPKVPDKLYNESTFFFPDGTSGSQPKLHMTRFENEVWKVSPGRGLTLFETEFGRVAIAICYDSEFPEICRAAARQGAVILVVPSYTDDRQGFLRVRYCAQARTVENQLFVVHSGTVGSLPAVPAISLNYGQASILSPSDFSMPRDGIIAEGQANQETIVIGDLDLKALRKLRSRGTVLPLRDSRHSAELVAQTTVVGARESAKLPRSTRRRRVLVRNTQERDFAGIREMARLIYPNIEPWSDEQLHRHLELFPQGQFVAVDTVSGLIQGMASGLIINWDRYETSMNWAALTDEGLYTNHDPVEGASLYAADVMVRPGSQGSGIGKRLYERARFGLARQIGLRRIVAGSRLRGYHRYAERMSAADYVIEVVNGRLNDPTLSFQLSQGFHVLDIIEDYFKGDPESEGWAAAIEWLNPEVADPEDYNQGDARFLRVDAE